ncbi:bifunctional 4-hydroxy-2-oxoglutarate aldolase/2-dehydro-3-deoxy-phosphogluconate aldolase [Parapedobacter pyrenivorans]|uniref:bifunctional 4-hydroxy-2-oxoglutarate aldolase/2-dehydro-3-deoxy-phosphogluconate aldolase n=1 Tax=Parapedobacter pyrenivorans TaxID=1305674 RepID=UPI003342DE88
MDCKSGFSWSLFAKMPVVGIMRMISCDLLLSVADIYCRNGFTTLEITVDSPGFDKALARCRASFQNKLNIGAGTVCCLKDLDRALEAGAQFVVTPNVNKPVIKQCKVLGIPIMVGAFSPTEVYRAWKHGASLVKLFPAGALVPSYLNDLKSGPMSQVDFLPTGGITFENATAYLAYGAKGIGVGSLLFDSELIEKRDWDALSIHFAQFSNLIREALNHHG